MRRPRYRDWSLPKGKADAGETPAVTAAREVLEETGFTHALGRRLTTVSYSAGGRPKTVHFFAARSLGGEFTANREVDRLDWLTVAQARDRMTYEFDRAVLQTFLLQPADLSQLVLVRHGRAGQRESYDGEDDGRPLDAKGRRQADALVGEILPFHPIKVHSAPPERCRATVASLADQLGVEVTAEPLLGEESYRTHPAGARRRLVELVSPVRPRPGGPVPQHDTPSGAGESDGGGPADADPDLGPGAVVACSQGGVIPGVVKSLAGRADVTIPKVGTPKASFWVLSFDRDNGADHAHLVQADHYPAPVV